VERVEGEPAARRIFRPDSLARFAAGLAGRRLVSVDRHGKQILIRLEGPRPRDPAVGLLSHLGMTGKWLRRGEAEPTPRHARARLHLDDGSVLHYQDLRLFGRLRLVPGARFDEVAELRALGPDPLLSGIDAGWLAEALGRRRIAVKIALLDQALLPGVGNIQASESLFRARIDPRRRANALSRSEVKRLASSVLASIRDTIAREAGPEPHYVEEPGSENPFVVYAREGERCPRCRRQEIRRIVQGQRSTFLCPGCQR
jgi:formamidopyrimidine-DNA glycosylase